MKPVQSDSLHGGSQVRQFHRVDGLLGHLGFCGHDQHVAKLAPRLRERKRHVPTIGQGQHFLQALIKAPALS